MRMRMNEVKETKTHYLVQITTIKACNEIFISSSCHPKSIKPTITIALQSSPRQMRTFT